MLKNKIWLYRIGFLFFVLISLFIYNNMYEKALKIKITSKDVQTNIKNETSNNQNNVEINETSNFQFKTKPINKLDY